MSQDQGQKLTPVGPQGGQALGPGGKVANIGLLPFTLYLGIPIDSGIDWTDLPYLPGPGGHMGIINYLKSWLSSCCGTPSPVEVRTVTQPQPAMRPSDGLVFLVGDGNHSVVSRVATIEFPDGTTGYTQSLFTEGEPQMISEVYVNGWHDYTIAATVYHELLHNKFWQVIDIHHTDGGNFTSATTAFEEGGPSAADQKLMCAALKRPAKQYQGGFSAVRKQKSTQ